MTSPLRMHLKGANTAPAAWTRIYHASKIVLAAHYRDRFRLYATDASAPEIRRDATAGSYLVDEDRDGTTDGYDLELTRAVADAVEVPVIASGGAGELDHLVEAVEEGNADAVLCASIFHYGAYTIAEATERRSEAGSPVRLTAAAA